MTFSPKRSASDIEKWKRLYESGMSIETIGKTVGVHPTTISRNLKSIKVQVNKTPQLKSISTDELVKMYNAGMNLSEIGRQTGMSYRGVSVRLNSYGIELPKKFKKIKEDDIPNIIQDYVEHGLTSVEIGKKYDVFYGTIIDHLRKNDIPIREYSPVSAAEKEIRDFLLESGIELSNRRKILKNNREIDILSKDEKIGIEYCGLYWHTEEQIDRLNHYNKWKECADRGIHLITIFEDEWSERKDIIKSVLLAKFGKFQTRIYARKCQVKHITKQEAVQFLEKNHIQGGVKSIHFACGLYYEDELVMVMTIGKHHRKSSEMVLNRLCSKQHVQVIGGANRCLNFLRPHVSNLTTWSDNRWSNGKVYKELGFTLDSHMKPDYSYTDKKIRRSKQSMKKSEINCPPELTEKQYASQLGWYRIWDCGKIRWKL